MRRAPTTRLHFGGLLLAEAGLILTATRSVDLIARVDCPIRALIGVQCPGCGSTRCIQSLGEGDVLSAFRHNPLLLSLLVFVMLYLVYGLVARLERQNSFAIVSTTKSHCSSNGWDRNGVYSAEKHNWYSRWCGSCCPHR